MRQLILVVVLLLLLMDDRQWPRPMESTAAASSSIPSIQPQHMMLDPMQQYSHQPLPPLHPYHRINPHQQQQHQHGILPQRFNVHAEQSIHPDTSIQLTNPSIYSNTCNNSNNGSNIHNEGSLYPALSTATLPNHSLPMTLGDAKMHSYPLQPSMNASHTIGSSFPSIQQYHGHPMGQMQGINQTSNGMNTAYPNHPKATTHLSNSREFNSQSNGSSSIPNTGQQHSQHLNGSLEHNNSNLAKSTVFGGSESTVNMPTPFQQRQQQQPNSTGSQNQQAGQTFSSNEAIILGIVP